MSISPRARQIKGNTHPEHVLAIIPYCVGCEVSTKEEDVTDNGNDGGSMVMVRSMPRNHSVDGGSLRDSTHEDQSHANLAPPR